ncbi:unnamed protein product [Prunus armeniaca]
MQWEKKKKSEKTIYFVERNPKSARTVRALPPQRVRARQRQDFTKHILLSMSNLRRVLERQHREDEEIRRRRVEEDHELDEEEEEVVLVVGMLNQSRQHHRGCAPNVDRHRHSRAALRMLAYGASADQVDEIARIRKSTILECLVKFCDTIETLYTRDYLLKPTPRDLRRLLQKSEARGFPNMIGGIDCMYWQWKNCPTP